MRTTVTIDDHLLERVKERARQDGVTLGEVFAASLHRYLAQPTHSHGPPLPVFRGGTGLAPGIDPTSNASLLAAAEEESDAEIARHFG